MKICVSAFSGSLDAEVDSRFGRCAYFVIVDSETGNPTVGGHFGMGRGRGRGR